MDEPLSYECQGSTAKLLGKEDIYDIDNMYNQTTFTRWLEYCLFDLPRTTYRRYRFPCEFRMNKILMAHMKIFKPNTLEPNYDCLIRKESQVQDLRKCLEIFEETNPQTVDWTAFKNATSQNITGLNVQKKFGYGCYYTEQTKRWVQYEEEWILKRFGYEFDQLSTDNCESVIF